MLDALAPLSAIIESEEGASEQTISAVTAAVKLLGNASARISHLRCTKIIIQVNKTLLPLVDEDSNFGEVSPSLFGSEFAQKSKELVDQVKAMLHLSSFFDRASPAVGGLQLQARTRRSPEFSKKQPPSSGQDAPKRHMEQVTHTHTFLNYNELEAYPCR